MPTVRDNGFTLIELMVVLAIVAILAAIAYPSYTKQVQESRRAKASACLLELAQYMERYNTTNMSYAGASLPTTSCRSELNDSYSFAFDGTPDATSFTIQATIVSSGSQSGDSCGTLSINQSGQKTPTTARCWRK